MPVTELVGIEGLLLFVVFEFSQNVVGLYRVAQNSALFQYTISTQLFKVKFSGFSPLQALRFGTI